MGRVTNGVTEARCSEEFAQAYNSRNSDELVDSSIPWGNDLLVRTVLENEIYELEYEDNKLNN